MSSPPHALALFAAASRLSTFDLVLVAVYLVAITLFGLRFREKKTAASSADKSLKSYFLANNTIPWWAIALSIVSAETSTLTIISVPGIAFTGNFGFLQLVIGYMLGRIVVALLFLPRYFAGEMLTAYQLIDRRFGPVLHKITAALFLLTRAAAEGVRVFAVSIVVGIAIGTRDVLSIAIISALTLLYTFEGGMTAVIWTDVVQMFLYIAGTLVAIFTLGSHVQGGWTEIHHVASAAGKFHMLNFTLNLTTTYTFWAGVLGGTFLTMASHGTDQLMVQRMLAARNLRESRLALLSSGAVIFLQFTLFLLIGAGLYVFYSEHPATFASADRIFPTFIVREMPIGIAGLLVAAILAAAMSNLSAALNSLSSTTVVDFYMRLRPAADARERNLIAKSSTVLWAFVLFGIAVYSIHAGGKGHVVEIGLSIASVAYGCLLGVFLLGTLTRFANQWGASIGMVTGFALNLWLWQGTFPVHLAGLTIPKVAYPWYTLIGALVTFAFGSLFSLIFRKQSRRTLATTTTVLLPLLFCLSFPQGICVSAAAQTPDAQFMARSHRDMGGEPQTPDFTPVSTLINDAIAAHKLPGAVLVIGHNGHIVFHQAYGNRKLAGEPGLDEKPSPAEPMTEDTIFDMASLTKCLATATAIMQLYDQGKIGSFDDPISKYLPEFLATSAPPRPGATTRTGAVPSAEGARAYQPGLPIHGPNAATTPSANGSRAYQPGLPIHGPDAATTPSANGSRAYQPGLPIHGPDAATTPSANGAPTYQPGPKAQVPPQNEPQRAEGPTHNSATNERAQVTLRMLLTHTSGEPPDVSLRDPWGLAAPDRAEGFHRALTTPLVGTPGAKFVYSDINFILLGALIEKLSGEREDDYVREHIYKPLAMVRTGYHAVDRTCGLGRRNGAAIEFNGIGFAGLCTSDYWMPSSEIPQTAPTAHDDEGTAATNPDFDHLLRGTVHDPTTRRMGGVAGHAGLFSTAHDVSLYAQALLDKLRNNTGPFPLKQSTLQLMTQPEQPGHALSQLAEANEATRPGAPGRDSRTRASAPDPLLAPAYPAIKDHNLRGFGWDIDTAFSKPRGAIFPIGSFGHTGFTGTSLWMDPVSNTYVILLANAIHPRGNPPISNLRGQVATAAANALGVTKTQLAAAPEPLKRRLAEPAERARRAQLKGSLQSAANCDWICPTLTGIDILEQTHFAALTTLATHHNNHLSLGLLTNQSGLDKDGHRTVDILHQLTTQNVHLTTLFSPEHGISGKQDTTAISAETDPATGLHVTSLYGPHDADKRPTHDQLKDLDAVVIDLQDAGVRFWTYESVLGYFLEAASLEKAAFHHLLDIVVLDRPNLIGGLQVQGMVSDPGLESYVNYMPLPLRHGMTFGELARYINAEKHLDASLTVVPLQNWSRAMFFADTGLPWTNPSPNLRSAEAAVLYPALGLIETTNISVGRGTERPFSFFGAGISTPQKPGAPGPDSRTRELQTPAQPTAWFNAPNVATYLTARHIPGVTFTAAKEPIGEDANHYPFHGQTIEAVRVTLTDRAALDSPELGIEILSALHHLYPAEFQLHRALTLIANKATMDALKRGDDPRAIAASWQSSLARFKADRAEYLLY